MQIKLSPFAHMKINPENPENNGAEVVLINILDRIQITYFMFLFGTEMDSMEDRVDVPTSDQHSESTPLFKIHNNI